MVMAFMSQNERDTELLMFKCPHGTSNFGTIILEEKRTCTFKLNLQCVECAAEGGWRPILRSRESFYCSLHQEGRDMSGMRTSPSQHCVIQQFKNSNAL